MTLLENRKHTPIPAAPFGPLAELPVADIRPAGWLKRYLETQRDGLTGHLEVAGYPFGIAGWALPEANNTNQAIWEPYEQDGYWLDGMIKAGLLLDDDMLLKKARSRMEQVLADAGAETGYLGPAALEHPSPDLKEWNYTRRRRWAHSVFFRAMLADAGEGERLAAYAEGLRRHYVDGTYVHDEQREVCNVEAMLWTYHATGDERLLEMAVDSFNGFNERFSDQSTSLRCLCSDKVPDGHGATYNEMSKLGAILYRYTGNEHWLEAAVNAYRKLDRHQMLVSGINSSSEHLRGKDPLDSYETCDIADFTWSQGHMLLATGDARYADALERACFNAAPGAVTADFKALQYFSCPNQALATSTSNHNKQFIGRQQMSYRPRPGTPCCPGSVHRIMPNYGCRMWMRHADGGVVAALYGASTLSTTVGPAGTPLRITQKTDYPFSERIEFQVDADETVSLPLWLRIPAWCDAPEVELNGEAFPAAERRGNWLRIERDWSSEDVLTLMLPMRLKLTRWGDGGVAIERGPIVYSLPIPAKWERDFSDTRSSDEFPAWNATPAGPWNYALDVDEETLEERVEVLRHDVKDERWWATGKAPVTLKVPARLVEGWTLNHVTKVTDHNEGADDLQKNLEQFEGDFLFTPPLPEPESLGSDRLGPPTHVTLAPFGSTRLRMTILPQVPH